MPKDTQKPGTRTVSRTPTIEEDSDSSDLSNDIYVPPPVSTTSRRAKPALNKKETISELILKDGSFMTVIPTPSRHVPFIRAWLLSFAEADDLAQHTKLHEIPRFVLGLAGVDSDYLCRTEFLRCLETETETAAISKIVAVPDIVPSRDSYPLVSKSSASLARNVRRFIDALISTVSEDVLRDEMLVYQLVSWAIAAASSSARAIRHAGTLVSMIVWRALVERKQHLEPSNEQDSVEEDSDDNSKNGDLDDIFNQYFSDVANKVFKFRYRDIAPAIRVTCLDTFKEIIITQPDEYFKVAHLRYHSWLLTDTAAPVRLSSLKGLNALVALDHTKMKVFVGRFKESIVGLSQDSSSTVRVEALRLIAALYKHDLLKSTDIEPLLVLLGSVDEASRSPVAELVGAIVTHGDEFDIVGFLLLLQKSGVTANFSSTYSAILAINSCVNLTDLPLDNLLEIAGDAQNQHALVAAMVLRALVLLRTGYSKAEPPRGWPDDADFRQNIRSRAASRMVDLLTELTSVIGQKMIEKQFSTVLIHLLWTLVYVPFADILQNMGEDAEVWSDLSEIIHLSFSTAHKMVLPAVSFIFRELFELEIPKIVEVDTEIVNGTIQHGNPIAVRWYVEARGLFEGVIPIAELMVASSPLPPAVLECLIPIYVVLLNAQNRASIEEDESETVGANDVEAFELLVIETLSKVLEAENIPFSLVETAVISAFAFFTVLEKQMSGKEPRDLDEILGRLGNLVPLAVSNAESLLEDFEEAAIGLQESLQEAETGLAEANISDERAAQLEKETLTLTARLRSIYARRLNTVRVMASTALSSRVLRPHSYVLVARYDAHGDACRTVLKNFIQTLRKLEESIPRVIAEAFLHLGAYSVGDEEIHPLGPLVKSLVTLFGVPTSTGTLSALRKELLSLISLLFKFRLLGLPHAEETWDLAIESLVSRVGLREFGDLVTQLQSSYAAALQNPEMIGEEADTRRRWAEGLIESFGKQEMTKKQVVFNFVNIKEKKVEKTTTSQQSEEGTEEQQQPESGGGSDVSLPSIPSGAASGFGPISAQSDVLSDAFVSDNVSFGFE